MNVDQKVSVSQYISYGDAWRVPDAELIVVDCHYPRGLSLTHLYGDRVPASVRSNTSTETTLKAIQQGLTEGRSFVTCNHWDIDGCLAVWSMLNPEEALAHRPLLVAAAMLGDFREFDTTSEVGLNALKLCALMNAVEAKEFCLPFGDLEDATIEYEVAEQKFAYFLPRLSGWLQDLDLRADLWQAEYDEVVGDLALIDSGAVRTQEHPEIGLSVIRSPRPLHYYAICSRIQGGAMLTLLESRRYAEFEYRYETRVGRLDKRTVERRDLTELAAQLSAMETAPGIHWVFDNILLGGPMLRPEPIDAPLPQEACYQSMAYRLREYVQLTTSIGIRVIDRLIIEALDSR